MPPSHTPILPADILREIFRHLLRDIIFPAPPDEHELRESSILNLVRATHVCRQWLAVALESAVLWAQIDGVLPGLVMLQLQRSRGVPLDFLAWTHHNHAGRGAMLTSYMCIPR